MRSRFLALAGLLSSSILIGAAGGLRPIPLFQCTFDLSALLPKAELGSFQFKAGTGLSVLPTAGGGFAAVLGGTGQDVYVQGMFADGKAISTGDLDITFSALPKTKGAFEVGIVIDEPTSAFYPASGSGNDGTLIAGGVPSGIALPINTEIEFALHLERDVASTNWSYTLVVSWADATQPGGTATITLSGNLANTAQRKILGIGFLKPGSSPAVIQLDDVLAMFTGK